MKKLSKILNESVWGGMLDRSMGDVMRKEDDPKYMNPEEFYEYLKNHYKLVKKNRYSKDIELYDDGTRILVPIVEELKLEHKLNIYIDYKKKGDGIFIFGEADKYKDILINGGVKLIQDGDVYTIVLDKGKTINEMFLICLDLLIEGIPSEERIIRKKVNESVWGGMLNRSVGDTVRKEDLIIDNETLKNKIKELYNEQGEGDTLDVSSLNKYKCDNLSYLFHSLKKVKQIIGLDTWDVSNVTDMSYMFNNCKSLTELNISNWDVSNVTNMTGIFCGCKSIKELNIDTWDVSNVTYMVSMFYNCSSLTKLNISNLDMSNVTSMTAMFYNCISLTELNISTWDVGKVTDMHSMFAYCSSLTELNISNWDVSNVTEMSFMFSNCSSLTELNISNWNVSNVTDMCDMFCGCKSIKELNIDTWDVSNVTNIYSMFYNCDKLIKPKWYKDE